MKLIDLNCPHCGATMTVDSNAQYAKCNHCGAILLVDDEKRHIVFDDIEEAGYKFEKGRQTAQNEQITNRYLPSKTEVPKKKNLTWLWVLGWIFVFPVPLTVLLLRKKEMKLALKYGIIAIAWVLYLVVAVIGISNKNSTENVYNRNNSDIIQRNATYTTSSSSSNKTPAPKTTDVFVDLESISIGAVEDILMVGESYELHALINPSNATNKNLTWKSSDSSIISVDNYGRVTALGKGTASITVSSDNGVSANIELTVDTSKRRMSQKTKYVHQDNNDIGSDWSYKIEINGEYAKNEYILSVGDVLGFNAIFTEEDAKPDIGKASTTHTVTEEDLKNGFTVSMNLSITENGGKNSGTTVRYLVTFTFEPK